MDWPTRLLCLWDFPGKNTGVGCHFLLQGIFPAQGLNPRPLVWQVDSLQLSHQGSPLNSTVLGITWQKLTNAAKRKDVGLLPSPPPSPASESRLINFSSTPLEEVMLIPDCSLSNAETQRKGHFKLLSPLTSQCEQFYQIADVAKVLNLGGGRERCRRTPARDCGSREELQWGGDVGAVWCGRQVANGLCRFPRSLLTPVGHHMCSWSPIIPACWLSLPPRPLPAHNPLFHLVMALLVGDDRIPILKY